MKTCGSGSDCRQGEGYDCIDPKLSPWTVILDTNQSERVCMFAGPMMSLVDSQVPQVCSADRPDAAPIDATVTTQAGREGGPDTGGEIADVGQEATDSGEEAMDAGQEAADSGQEDGEAGDTPGATADASADAVGDAQADGTLDAIVDSDVVDAPDGG
jgi:hypothetical protein